MNKNELFKPFLDLPTVFQGKDSYKYFIEYNESFLMVKFNENGFLDEQSLKLRNSATEEVQSIIDILEQKHIHNLYTDIEDDDSSNDDVTEPFDPNSISIEKKIISMDTVIRRLVQGSIKLNPGFQRKEVWNDERKSRLIESLLLKIPIPMFYVSADNNDLWSVVDGLQRLSSIRDFVLGEKYMRTKDEKNKGDGMKLVGLEFCNDKLEGFTMKDLPVLFNNRIMETEFTFTIINPGTPEDVKRNIFKRINTGGMTLSQQEIRNALYGGQASSLLTKLSMMSNFKTATGGSVKTLRMEDKELILRFVSFLLRDPEKYDKSQNIDTWLGDSMIIYNSLPTLESPEVRKLIREGHLEKQNVNIISEYEITDSFSKAMSRGFELFSNHAFRKSIYPMRRTPINKSLFETWGIVLSRLSDDEFTKLLKNRVLLINEYKESLYNNNFIVAISRDSMSKASVKYRYNLISNLVKKNII